MELDSLSSVFMRLRLNASFQNSFSAAGWWHIEVPAHKGIKIHTILKGQYWLSVADDPEPKQLQEGDCYLLPRGSGFVMTSHPSVPEQVSGQEVVMRSNRGISTINGSGDCLVSGLFFDFESLLADILFQSLPPFVMVPAATNQASELHVNIKRFAAEFHGSSPGRSLIMYQLAPVILVDIIRTYLSEQPANATWFGALSDNDLSKVLNLMHTEYERRWTLEDLADSAAVSRSKLAARFRSTVGIPPMEYLCRWRMDIARELLANEQRSITEVSRMVGYESESAFSAAFRRILNRRPGYYQKRKSSGA